MATTQLPTRIVRKVEYDEKQEQRSALFGLIKWWVKLSAEKIGQDIYIISEQPISQVFLNDERIK